MGCELRSLTGPVEPKVGLFQISVEEIHLNPEMPAKTDLGLLQYQGGLAISSKAPAFGGLSGLVLMPKGDGLIALNDHGDVLQAMFVRGKVGQLTGLDIISSHRLRGVNGEHLTKRLDKRDQDAEAIERLMDGSFLVSFEIRHRMLRYKELKARPSLFSVPPGIEKAPRNGGIESMAPLPDGRILVLTENYRTKGKNKGDYIGWLLDHNGISLGNIYWTGYGLFRPTDFATLPNGDVLLLQRRYTVAGGPGMRLSLIPARQVKPGARMLGVELAKLVPPYTVDNFEGLAVFPDKRGGTIIYILSDDNFNPLQRTLLLQFRLPG